MCNIRTDYTIASTFFHHMVILTVLSILVDVGGDDDDGARWNEITKIEKNKVDSPALDILIINIVNVII